MGKIVKGVSILIGVLVVIGLVLSIGRLLIRKYILEERKIAAINGVDESLELDIGGIKQAVQIRGQDVSNPVLFVIHGGPGMPMTAISYKYQDELEKKYIVVNWDQRNAGKTYFLNQPSEVSKSLCVERSIQDMLEITKYLEERFGKKGVVVLGHSYGSILGTIFTQTYPEHVKAYIGCGQQVDLEEFISSKGTYSEATTNLALYAMLSPYYTFEETSVYTLNIEETQRGILQDDAFRKFDIRKWGNAYEVPVFYILGEKDSAIPYTFSEEFFGEIKAPFKEKLIIKDAGHMMMFDNPKEFARFINEDVWQVVK